MRRQRAHWGPPDPAAPVLPPPWPDQPWRAPMMVLPGMAPPPPPPYLPPHPAMPLQPPAGMQPLLPPPGAAYVPSTPGRYIPMEGQPPPVYNGGAAPYQDAPSWHAPVVADDGAAQEEGWWSTHGTPRVHIGTPVGPPDGLPWLDPDSYHFRNRAAPIAPDFMELGWFRELAPPTGARPVNTDSRVRPVAGSGVVDAPESLPPSRADQRTVDLIDQISAASTHRWRDHDPVSVLRRDRIPHEPLHPDFDWSIRHAETLREARVNARHSWQEERLQALAQSLLRPKSAVATPRRPGASPAGITSPLGTISKSTGAPPAISGAAPASAGEQPVDLYDGDEHQCPLCLEQFSGGEPVARLVCRHMLHDSCFEGLRARSSRPSAVECPVCRGRGTVIARWRFVAPWP